MPGIEITEPCPVMDIFGRPVNFGWARTALFDYNPPLIGGAVRARISGTDRYIIFSATHLVVFEVTDGGYLGHVGVSVFSVKDHSRSSYSIDNLFSFGRFGLPQNSDKGFVKIQDKKYFLDFVVMPGGARIIKMDYPRFAHRRHLRGEVVLTPAFSHAQSIAAVSRWRRDKYAFRYLRCSPWFIAEGVIQFGSTEIYFTQDNAWAIYDWKREVRPKRDVRYWAAACGMAGDKLVGFNIGYGDADTSAGTENSFFLDGVINKLDQVTFHIPPADWLDEWKFTSNDKRLEMAFTPFQQKIESRNMLFHSVKCHQVCGTFSGRVILDDGSTLSFLDITGFAERQKTRF
jgi:hypothetical protein